MHLNLIDNHDDNNARGDDYNTPGNDDNDDEDDNPDDNDEDDANDGDGDGECYLFIVNRPETVK